MASAGKLFLGDKLYAARYAMQESSFEAKALGWHFWRLD
jgi:hypothetical protein